MRAPAIELPEHARLRTSPGCEVVLFDRLPDAERHALANVARGADFYGLARVGCGDADRSRVIDRESALLLLTMREPGELPSYVRSVSDSSVDADVLRMIADGLLEIEYRGKFLSGPAAMAALAPEGHRQEGATATARLSLAAMTYVAALDLPDPARIAELLYGYHRQPLTRSAQRRLASLAEIETFLGVGAGGGTRRAIERDWTRLRDGESEGWIFWQSNRFRPSSGSDPGYKLYISPRCAGAPEALFAAAAILPRRGATHLKVGGTVSGLLRTDKMVAYFGSLESLREAAMELATELDGLPSHGVPFTAEIANDGLLSWGMDPPAARTAWQRLDRQSWRYWVVNRLAALLRRTTEERGSDAVDFALQRLRLDGVDTTTWTPSQTIWADTA